jgi:AraC family transcriptional regulator
MPAKTTTRLDHARRIDRAIRHLAQRLDAPLSLDDLAAVACFSPCHFHRIFHAATGETPVEALRRLRLDRAAAELVQGTAPIPAIARRAGYGSAAAFTRAFAGYYGTPPAAYRACGLAASPSRPDPKMETAMHDVRIEDRPAFRLAAIAHSGHYTDIGATFDRVGAWMGARGLIDAGTRWIGIYHDDPAQVPVDKLRSEACGTVGSAVGPDETIRIVGLAGGRHAVLRFKGPYSELEGAYRWLFGTWLPASGEEAADRPCHEEYLNDPKTTKPADLLTDICLPLVPR